jgi:hypothetical protein
MKVLGPPYRIEVTGGLVGEHDVRTARQSTSGGDPLLLTPRELARQMVQTVAQPDLVDQRGQPGSIGLSTRQRQRQEDVLLGRKRGHEIEGLEYETDLVAPYECLSLLVQLRQIGRPDEDLTGGQIVQSGQAVQ